MNKGIEVIDWDLLTKREDATFLTYRITVKQEDKQKVQDVHFWPEGLRTRSYQPPAVKKNMKTSKRQETGNMKHTPGPTMIGNVLPFTTPGNQNYLVNAGAAPYLNPTTMGLVNQPFNTGESNKTYQQMRGSNMPSGSGPVLPQNLLMTQTYPWNIENTPSRRGSCFTGDAAADNWVGSNPHFTRANQQWSHDVSNNSPSVHFVDRLGADAYNFIRQ